MDYSRQHVVSSVKVELVYESIVNFIINKYDAHERCDCNFLNKPDGY